MVQFEQQNLSAKLSPVGSGVKQVEVPSFIDIVRWGDRMAGRNRQKCEPLVLLDDAFAVTPRPPVLLGKTSGVRILGPGVIEGILIEPLS